MIFSARELQSARDDTVTIIVFLKLEKKYL